MIIDREKLIHLLMEKTEMEKLEVESQLDELTNRILDAARRGKALEIKQFGLFYFDEEGNLNFDVSEQLDKEINFQYAGMEPVELRPPRKTDESDRSKTEEDLEEDIEDDKEPAFSNDQSAAPDEPEDADDLFGIGKTLKGNINDEESEEKAEPFEKLFQSKSSDIEPKEKEELKKAGTTPAKETPEPRETPQVTDKKPAKDSRDPMNVIIFIVLGIVAVVMGYLLIIEYLDAPEQPETAQQQVTEIEEPPVTAEQDITDPAEPEALEQVELPEDLPETGESEAPETTDDTQDETPDDDRYGLYGDFTEGSGDEFTIVVHSLDERSIAEQTADEFRQDGYRANVTERTVDGRLFFRVNLGQFPSIQSAQEEAAALPAPFNNQYFIQRLQ